MGDSAAAPDVDAVVVGGGFSGLYGTKCLLKLGLSVRAFDAGSRAGGVWNWNSYPGARTDSLAETYQFSSDPEFAKAWEYQDSHPDQREVLSYLERFAEHNGLLEHYTFDTTVVAATYDEATELWTLSTSAGEEIRARYFVPAMGLVSAPNLPHLTGLESFDGDVYHTSRWPSGGVDLTGKRVAVIGTGSSGVQLITAIADEVESLVIFQRTPNWVAPTGVRPLTAADKARIRDNFDVTWKRVRQHPAGWPWDTAERSALDVSAEERDQAFAAAWDEGGFSLLYKSFHDVGSDLAANEFAREWMTRKIASIVHDPDVAAKLTPSYPYGAKRPPSGDGWYAVFNKDNVELVDIRDTPITSIDAAGVVTSGSRHDVDVIVMATGFDAITGAYTCVDIRGTGGRALRHTWSGGPDTYLGIAVAGFPNMFMIGGPQTPVGNLPPGAQEQADWIAALIHNMRTRGVVAMEPTEQAQQEWNRVLYDYGASSLARFGKEANSWFTGSNIEGKAFAYNLFFGGANVHADLCDQEAAEGYPGFRVVDPGRVAAVAGT